MNAVIEEKNDKAPFSSRRQMLASLLFHSRLVGSVSLLRSALVRDLRILAYHRVLSIADEEAFDFDLELVSASESGFREQMSLLKQRFNPVRFSDVIEAFEQGKRLPARPVIVTFDDGYDDNYRIAFSILRELGVPATFFVSTGHIDSGLPFSYDWFVHMITRSSAARLEIRELDVDRPMPRSRTQRRELATELLDRMKWLDASTQEAVVARLESDWSMPRRAGHVDCRPMSWDQLREMHAGGMEIGSHGMWHNMLAKLSPDAMRNEVFGSKAALDRELDAPTVALSYPVGGNDAYDENVIATASEAGYKLGCSYISGTSPMPAGPHFELRRLPIERHMDLAWFASLVGIPEAFSYPSRHRLG
ncbi:MAG: polysaccharide deacetylase family protein [Dokdonella sp.]|uniref:polysaccharide deacetylase family protein n=1 Tax=Dokdonella sp. TaxID=2291710 RepID=UPI002C149F63|nr:polysaccharide deacetylase family protein [Dokdonella sp.]HOX72369.1 polysaccharide deacetylase family protein [Dokdonella sp.]HPG93222.1 polysaccharide deacetylase family protein [Dokdonella sp.]HPN80024.1 polysaccharide deacetylase family protein [Dokdonella sp.]